MEPYQERVVEEKKQLDEKIEKLKAFMITPVAANLDKAEISRLQNQGYYMTMYSHVLGDRIAAFV